MHITILGTGCPKCRSLEAATRAAIEDLGLDADIQHVTDPGEIAAWGVMSTPALVVDDDVVLAGRVPTASEVTTLLALHRTGTENGAGHQARSD